MPLFAPPKLTETYTTTFFLPSSTTESYVSPISNLLLTDGNGGTYFTTFPTELTVSTIHSLSTFTSVLITSTIKSQDILLSNYIPEFVQPFIVAVGKDLVPANQIQSSTDGSNWSPSIASFDSGSYPTGVAYNGSTWVATVTDGVTSLLYSTDAREWDPAIGGFNLSVNGVAWGSSWLAFGLSSSGNSIVKSTDGSNWSSSVTSGGFTSGANSGAWTGSLWVAVGTGTTSANSIQSSSDGSNWSSVLTGGFTGSGRCIVWNASYWLAGGYDADEEKTIQKSTDGSNWSPSLSAHLTQVNCLAWNGSKWIAGGELTSGSTLESSTDGRNWTTINEEFPGDCYGITWLPSFWVATGGDTVKKTIKTSTDGLTWDPIVNGGFSVQGYAIASTSNIIPYFTYFTEISPSYITTSNILTNTVTLIDESVESMVLSSENGTLYYGASPVLTNNGSVSYINTVAQSIPSLVYTAVNWNSIDTRQTYGLTKISTVGTSFSNYSMNVLCLSVTGYIGWNIGGNAGSSRNVLAFLNGTVLDVNSCLSYSSIPAPSTFVGQLNPVVNFSFNTILNPSDYFNIYVYHNDTTAQGINTQTTLPGSRITLFVK